MSAIGGIGALGAAAASSQAAASSASSSSKFDEILEAFKKAVSQMPEDRARDAVLKKNNLSEDDYNKLPPEKKEAIDKEVAEAVRKVHERKTGVALPDSPLPTEQLFG